MNFTFVPDMTVTAALSVCAAAVALILIIYCPRFRRVSRRAREDGEARLCAPEDLPEVSVVVYANDDAEFLRKLLPDILKQDYPAPFEVIVVNEGQSDATAEAVNLIALSHDNLYLTFTPEGARNLSRKKLALTLGVKAARYGVIVTVDADTEISSDHWLARMAGHFADPECGVVIGACSLCAGDDMPGRRFRAFDNCADSVTYLSAALSGHPYRGTSHNLAYRRNLFFENKGFSRSLNLRYGDDDIFVSEIARRDNTQVELSADSLTRELCYNPRRAYREYKQRSAFTGRFVAKSARRLMGLSSACFWVWLGAGALAVVAGLPSLVAACAVLALTLGLWIPVIIAWRRAMKALGYRPLGWSLPLFILARPLHTLIVRLRTAAGKVHNYTWG